MARSNKKKTLENGSTKPRSSLIKATANDKKLPKKPRGQATSAPAEPPQPLFNKMLASGNPQARRWMWTGIIVFAVAIFAIWGWSLKEQIASIKWSESPENRLINKTRQDWNQLFEEEKVSQEKNNLKNALQGIITHYATSTAATTTTPVAATTTPTT